MVEVGGKVGAGHEDVVQIDENERKVPEKMIHEALKGLCRVFQAERHGEELEEPKRRDDSRFGNILRSDGNLVIAFHKVELGEDVAAMETGGKILEVGQGVAVMNGGQVEAAEITAWPPGAVGFGHKVKRRRPGTVGAANDAGCLQFGEFSLGLFKPVGSEATSFGEDRRPGGVDMVLYPMERNL